MSTYNLFEPWESIDTLLKKGEKDKLLEQVFDISDMNDDDDDEEGKMDEETFQSTSD